MENFTKYDLLENSGSNSNNEDGILKEYWRYQKYYFAWGMCFAGKLVEIFVAMSYLIGLGLFLLFIEFWVYPIFDESFELPDFGSVLTEGYIELDIFWARVGAVYVITSQIYCATTLLGLERVRKTIRCYKNGEKRVNKKYYVPKKGSGEEWPKIIIDEEYNKTYIMPNGEKLSEAEYLEAWNKKGEL